MTKSACPEVGIGVSRRRLTPPAGGVFASAFVVANLLVGWLSNPYRVVWGVDPVR